MDSTAGFVLTGGRSSRMGRDKALLPIEGSVLVERTAERVRAAAGSVTLIGAPGRYAHLGLPVLPDLVPDGGPGGPICGIHTALKTTIADWNLVVACDMPRLTAPFLRSLLDRAQAEGKACLVPQTSQGLEPLCAVYHRRALPAVDWAVHHNVLKMQDFVKTLDPFVWPVPHDIFLENWNTPQDLAIK